MNPPTPISSNGNRYSARQLAQALGVSKRWILKTMQSDPQGQQADQLRITRAWALEELPAEFREKLAAEAARQGYRSVDAMLLHGKQPWQPEVPLHQLSEECLENARKLQRALRPTIDRMAAARLNGTTLNGAEIELKGVEEFRAEFGYSISCRQFRAILKRTMDRDRGFEQFDRLEIYLGDRLKRKRERRLQPSAADAKRFEPIQAVITSFRDPANPTPDERAYLWLQSFEFLEEQIEAGASGKKAKLSLIEFLSRNAGCLAASKDALRVAFHRKQRAWIESGGHASVLIDGRTRREKFQPSKESTDLITARAILECGGRISQTWRKMLRDGELPRELADRYTSNASSKSYVPNKIRQIVGPDVKRLKDIHHGPRRHALNSAFVDRDWEGVKAGDWYQADDLTAPIYFFQTGPDMRPELLRGQVLVMIDLRSTFILHVVLIPEKSYNSRAIRTQITQTCDQHGMPRLGFYFERGIWENARLIKGVQGDPLTWGEIVIEVGLSEHKLKFVHARFPRAKPVERVLGAIQNLMEGLPGYAGRNESIEKFEALQKSKLAVERGAEDPSQHFMTADQWMDRLVAICEEYNHEPQDGKMLQGLSPDDGWHQFNDPTNPQIRLDASIRYLLAHHKFPVKVTRNGVRLPFGKYGFIYRSEETGAMVGEKRLAWYDPAVPDSIVLTDMQRKNPVVIPRAPSAPAMPGISGDTTELKEAMRSVAAHQRYAPTRYRTLKSRYARPFRLNVVDRPTLELGREIKRQTDAVETSNRETQTSIRRSARLTAQLNVPPEILNPDLAERERGARLMLKGFKDAGMANPKEKDLEES